MRTRGSDSSLGRVFDAGEVIVAQGDEGSCMYVIQSGEVEVVKQMGGREVRLGTMGPGEFFGEMALFQPEGRAATVRALSDVRVVTVDKRTLLRRIEEDPMLAYNLVEAMADRIRELHGRVQEAMERPDD